MVGWLGIAFLAVGLILFNFLIVILGCLVLFYLFASGWSFLRTFESSKYSVQMVTWPKRIETSAGQTCQLVTQVENNTLKPIRVGGVKYSLTGEAVVERQTAAGMRVGPNSKEQIEGVLVPNAPGRFEIGISLVVESPMGLFTHSLQSLHKVNLLVRVKEVVSVRNRPNLDLSRDTFTDQMHRGVGTDLAGINPYRFMDDLRRIDWNATARTGRLMVRDFYVERDPGVILVIELSARFRELLPKIIETIEETIRSIPMVNPVGLILYDKHTIVARFDPRQGAKQRMEIVRSLSRLAYRSFNETSTDRFFRPYFSLRRELRSMRLAVEGVRYSERVRSLARIALPYYKKAGSTYFKQVRELGVVKAFQIEFMFSQPGFVVVICTPQTDMEGLYEGAKIGLTVPHRIVIALLNGHEPAPDDLVSTFQRLGVRILQCTPEGLPEAVSTGVRELGQLRQIHAEATR